MTPHPGHPGSIDPDAYVPRLIAWEVTRTCLLNCKHCRAAANREPCKGEFTTEECFRLLDNVASFAKPIIILTGGEPMLREDIYDIASHADKLGLPVVMAPCGLLLNDKTAAKIKASGIRRISLSLDGATAQTHDAFRGFPGSFDAVMQGVSAARRAGLDFQINTTISRHNLDEVQAIMDLAIQLGASLFNPFLLVPTGRGRELIDQELTAAQYEQALNWLARQQSRKDIQIRVTCAPHYQRIIRQAAASCGGPQVPHSSRGCMGGKGFAFISHVGKVQICGFLDTECGDVRAANYDFHKIWDTSEVFLQMRDVDHYKGRCGYCEFRKVCGGCRARAHALTGDYLNEEPFCVYQPKRRSAAPPPAPARPVVELDDVDRKILGGIQADFPVAAEPYRVLAQRLNLPAVQILARVEKLLEGGIIRRLGAVFDSRRLGYFATLVAAKIPDERLEAVAALVSKLPGVTHNYRRQHVYNLWFTLTCRSREELDATLERLRRQTGIDAFYSLPALAMYKSRVTFMMDDEPAAPPPAAAETPAQAATLSASQKQLVRLLQESLPLTLRPYDELAEQCGKPLPAMLGQISEWESSGIIKRIGAVIAHRHVGFVANGMAVFNAPPERIDEIGQAMAQYGEITHCYHRPSLSDWPYNLFAMIHGHSEQEVRQFVDKLAAEFNLPRHDVLFSTTEYKKVSMRFFVENQPPR